MNPHSNVSKIFSEPLGEQDHTVIFHIPLPNLVINDIFVDDHHHYWSISEELSRMTPDKNPLTNLPFEPKEWERILKARTWGKVEQPVPQPVQMIVTVDSTGPITQIPTVTTYEPVQNSNCSWICCGKPIHCRLCDESYDVECSYLCMYVRRNGGLYPGTCVWSIPLFCCTEVGNEDGCYPLCCTFCFSKNSCLFRTRNVKGFFAPCGFQCINDETQFDWCSCLIINNFYRRTSSNHLFTTLPLYCHCSKNGKECCITPLCIEVGDCFMTPFVCNKGPLFCFLGIPFMKYNSGCDRVFSCMFDCECCC